MESSLHEDLVCEFCCVGSIFSMKLLGFVSKATRLTLAFSALTSLRSVNTEKAAGSIFLH